MKKVLTILMLLLATSTVFANATNDLNNWLDSTFNAENISWQDADSEFKKYADDNYKEISTITEFLEQFKPKKRFKGAKEFELDRPKEYPALQKIAKLSKSQFKTLENELYRIILSNGLEKNQNAFTYLWIYINHINNIPLNDTRPNDLVYELYQLKQLMIVEDVLFERVALMILTRKIFAENNYIHSESLVNKTFPRTKVVYLKGKDVTDYRDTTIYETAEPIQDFAEVDPSFIGGSENMISFIVLNVHYPEESRIMAERGTVYVKFVVDTDGSITKVAIRKGVSKNLDREAVRVIQLMPKWIPGQQAGEAVSVNFTLPIAFRLG